MRIFCRGSALFVAEGGAVAEVAVAAGGAAAPAAALLRLLGLEHDKQRQPQAQRPKQEVDQNVHIYHPLPSIAYPPAPAGGIFTFREKYCW